VGHTWQRRLGRYPGDWIWASLVLLLVAAGSATAGIVTARDTGTRGQETIVATSRVVTAPARRVALPAAKPKSKPATTAAPRPAARPRPARRGSLASWPARDGYTVVLASIPARGSGSKDATAAAKAALARGLQDVGVLASARFASLHPGYYVVFAGVYGSLEDAQTAVSRISSKFPNAYAREIAR
jgi:septal ring-binding cell division protein DamX